MFKVKLERGKGAAGATGSSSRHPSLTPPPPLDLKAEDDDDDDIKPLDGPDLNKIALAKVRYEADLKKHHYEPPVAARLQDDWQVAYVWAFLVKFQVLSQIRKLECIEDFERCLVEPVANRPDDILENVLIRFLHNLKPGLRNLNCTNIQNHLSNYITDQLLNSPEFTVWDRPWAPNEEARGPCCNDSHDRMELGRLRYDGEPISERAKKNPIAQMEERGGGLFELDWRERAKLLRQLVDWQLTHAESIRGIINKEYQFRDAKTKNAEGLDTSIQTTPLGQDRDKARIWAFDSSGRIYRSGNPFKRPCPLVCIVHTHEELLELQAKYEQFGSQKVEKPKGANGKKPTATENRAYSKLVKGVEDERNLAAKIAELIPAVEKEEQRIQRARKRIAQATQLAQMAEIRTTRTRRSTKRVDYTYGDDLDEAIDEPFNKRSRADGATWEGSSTRGKVVVPGERRSARVSAREASEGVDTASNASFRLRGEHDGVNGDAYASSPANGNGTVAGTEDDQDEGDHPSADVRPMRSVVEVAID